ncbi:MAG TPA: MazG nucleotide pyrophosphohydrolase domain-containing protein [Thermodesulfobacteriota bacterium]|nr:hypothetical protein [Deltaproteobacteria bacterium]HNR11776.1 MazG nucleotide pyrophosphohydrolase domain-containing protein [Thermodesulfobacteriota bacterium]HNU72395.1 MazG nucleotide pyrophosphohydrolase domain-containing protein [Thermodesulfobacteriota bacterium]HOC38212.1 MazG nucleotide pyrophosphohydrolase domain-containing protein [Thermodesulfobacteriota bacterium]HQO77864.1 MazG nucleotide pyrophosphohydrolase domain-containing protein [Thermodesulfobacteriota bacterium]
MNGTAERFQAVLDLIRTLRGEGGCPWDRQQTVESLTPYVHQEFEELAEALASKAPENVQEEMGDLIFLLLFVAEAAKDRGDFAIDDVFEQVQEKMVGRHPHIFGAVQATEIHEIKDNWKKIKEEEKIRLDRKTLNEKMPRHLPALQQMMWVLRTVQPDSGGDPLTLADRIEESTTALLTAVKNGKRETVRCQAGRLFFLLVRLSLWIGSDPEVVIREEIRRVLGDAQAKSNGVPPLAGL